MYIERKYIFLSVIVQGSPVYSVVSYLAAIIDCEALVKRLSHLQALERVLQLYVFIREHRLKPNKTSSTHKHIYSRANTIYESI